MQVPAEVPCDALSEELSNDALLNRVQRQTFRYFWDFAHPTSGLTRERRFMPGRPADLVATGASGFGVMAILVGIERGWIRREEALHRLLTMVRHLERAQCYHGVFPHWLNGQTGATIQFDRKDDGADLVETSYLIQGLLCARQYFDGAGPESELRARINRFWHETEWSWHTRGNRHVLYWHWSPNHGWSIDYEIRGWNECLITYILAAAAPRYTIDADAYHRGWANGRDFRNGRTFYGIELPLGPDFGGPLCFAHYSFLGLDPRGLRDRYADYWTQNVNHVLINRQHCVRNPHRFKGYGARCWGLTSDDSDTGYRELSPTSDFGVIAPNAALASFPYTPNHSMEALRHFYDVMRAQIWGEYGFTSAFCEARDWFSDDYIGIDQGPIVIMIENHRSGLLWKLFMSCPEVQAGLRKLGFESPYLESGRSTAIGGDLPRGAAADDVAP